MSEEIVKRDEPSQEIFNAIEHKNMELDVAGKIQSLLISDMEEALNIILSYQAALKTLCAPDRDFVQARKLMNKYNMAALEPSQMYKILLGGRDITTHPDSIPGTAIDVVDSKQQQTQLERWSKEEEEWGDEAYGTSIVRISFERTDEGAVVHVEEKDIDV